MEISETQYGGLEIRFKCIICGKEVIVFVHRDDFEKFKQGKHVQDCFPYLEPGERELFLTSICDNCFQEMFKEN